MTDRRPGTAPSPARRWALAQVLLLLAAGVLAGCAIPFGEGSDSGRPVGGSTFKESNSLFLQEQQIRARQRGQEPSSFIVPDRF